MSPPRFRIRTLMIAVACLGAGFGLAPRYRAIGNSCGPSGCRTIYYPASTSYVVTWAVIIAANTWGVAFCLTRCFSRGQSNAGR
jgi:hypothetical protein